MSTVDERENVEEEEETTDTDSSLAGETSDEGDGDVKESDSNDEDSTENGTAALKHEDEEEVRRRRQQRACAYGLMVKRPKGWTTTAPILSNVAQRTTRAFIFLLNVLMLVFLLISVQYFCLYRDACYFNENPSLPHNVTISIIPLCLIATIVVVPLGIAASSSSSKMFWMLHISVTLAYALLVISFLIYGVVEFTSVFQEKKCVATNGEMKENCTAWELLSTKERSFYRGDQSDFDSQVNHNGASMGVAASLASVLCIIDVSLSLSVLIRGPSSRRRRGDLPK